MKSLNNYINESAGSKIYVLYAAPKSGEDSKKKLCDRITIGVYSNKKDMKSDEDEARKVLDEAGYKDYEILSYEHNLNLPLIDM